MFSNVDYAKTALAKIENLINEGKRPETRWNARYDKVLEAKTKFLQDSTPQENRNIFKTCHTGTQLCVVQFCDVG